MALVIGVDAGGTATRAVLATLTGAVVGRGTAGPGNPISAGHAAAAGALGAAVRAALAGYAPSDVVAGVVGVAGVSRLADRGAAEAYAIQWATLGLGCRMRAYGDAVTAFAAGTPAPDGTVLIAGTGAVAAEIGSWRVLRTADGLGWLLGDEGSGLWVGLRAVRTAARAWAANPTRPPTALAELAAGHAAATTPEALIGWANQAPHGEIAALAPAVCAAARAGEPESGQIVRAAAARLVATLDELGPVAGPVVLAGGLLSGDTPVRDGVVSALRHRGTPVLTGRDPAAGAAWLAARAAARLDDVHAAALHAALVDR